MKQFTIRFNQNDAKAEFIKLNDECLIMIEGENINITDGFSNYTKEIKMKIFELIFIVKNPNIPFKIESHESFSSGNLIWILSQFQIHLIKILEIINKQKQTGIVDNDIPF